MRDTREPRLGEVPLGGTLKDPELVFATQFTKRISTRWCCNHQWVLDEHYISRPEIETAFSLTSSRLVYNTDSDPIETRLDGLHSGMLPLPSQLRLLSHFGPDMHGEHAQTFGLVHRPWKIMENYGF
jgi:hypothetical protein